MRGDLLDAGVNMSLVSIGRPDVGLELCDHLGVKDGYDWVYADPDNGLHDALVTNRGWDTMIRPATALRFRDRIFGGKGGKGEGGTGEGSLDQVRGSRAGTNPRGRCASRAIGREGVRPIGCFVPSRIVCPSHDFFDFPDD